MSKDRDARMLNEDDLIKELICVARQEDYPSTRLWQLRLEILRRIYGVALKDFAAPGIEITQDGNFKAQMRVLRLSTERTLIIRALEAHHWNRKKKRQSLWG